MGVLNQPAAEFSLTQEGISIAGRAEIRHEDFEMVLRLARLEGLVFDPVYTAKAFGGLLDALRRDPRRFGRRVCFVHTGGIFSVFPFRAELASAGWAGSAPKALW